MKKRTSDHLKVATILIPVMLVVSTIDLLPWWSFVVPVVCTGMIAAWQKWHIASFSLGSGIGFLVWLGASVYFDATGNGIILQKTGALFGVNKVIVLLISGIVGGLITGLALYTGKKMLARKVVYSRENTMN